MSTVLITGGTGLIGRALTKALIAEGHAVRYLSRSTDPRDGIPTYTWDVPHGVLDPSALHDVDHIVHLAGAGIADKRWTASRVHELIDSRAGSARLLLKVAREQGSSPKSFISAAGIGYYGAITSDHVFTENDRPGNDTIARISRDWEAGVDEWTSLCRVVKLRTPPVLAREGTLAKLAAPARWGLAAPLGSGHQWMPWVHIDDLVRAYQRAISDDRMGGAYNVNAPEQPTNREFMHAVAHALHKPFFPPRVPGLALRLILGEMANVILQGSRASNARVLATGFRFHYVTLMEALNDLLGGQR